MNAAPKITPRADGKWIVDTGRTLLAKRKRLVCHSEAEAKAVAGNLATLAGNEGRTAIVLSDALRFEAHLCSERLKAVGLTLTMATEAAIAAAGGEALARPSGEVVEAFLREKAQAGCRPEYLDVQGYVLRKFAADLPGSIHETTPVQISEWIHAGNPAPRTRKNRFQDLRNLFGFALRKKWVTSNPLLTLTKPIADDTTPGILTPAQAETLLRLAVARGGTMTAFVALGLFAGIRTDELGRLQWSKVSDAKAQIEIGADIAKKRHTRYPPICATLAAWLATITERPGAIAPAKIDSQWLVLRDAWKVATGAEWPKNAMRHSFASYHFAAYDNAPATAAILGHHGDTAVLFAHYRALATKEDAAKYWAILP